MADKILNVSQAAQILNVSDEIMRGLIASGKVKSHKVVGDVFIKQSDLDQYLTITRPKEQEQKNEEKITAKKETKKDIIEEVTVIRPKKQILEQIDTITIQDATKKEEEAKKEEQ